jgi:hypothetical protein
LAGLLTAVIMFHPIEKRYDAMAFKTYVKQVLVPNLWVGACVVMDNLPAHKVTGKRAGY